MKPWIRNVSKDALPHIEPSDILIQIENPDGIFENSNNFKHIFRFRFLGGVNNPHEELNITDEQSASLAKILQSALSAQHNVVVQCVSGSVRSGAVAQAGIDCGFQDYGDKRKPSKLVYQKILKYLLLKDK